MSRRSHAGGRVRHHGAGRGSQRDSRRPAPSHDRPQINRTPEAGVPPEPTRSVVDPNAQAPDPLVSAPEIDPPSAPLAVHRPAPPALPTDAAGGHSNGPPTADPAAFSPAAASRPVSYDGACTAPQLRRFIKSRAYVPMHELRRRFGINGAEDDVTPVALDGGRVYIGLPFREGALLGELLRAGEVGFELSMDPVTPIVVGVYPMRPVPRP